MNARLPKVKRLPAILPAEDLVRIEVQEGVMISIGLSRM